MLYLGEFLSPQNSISDGQDRLTKYFYFRPDLYENPDADLENIFIIKNMAEFPKRLDPLEENNLYVVDTIEVSKRISDEEPGVKNVSYIVTATYDLKENIDNRESGTSASAEADVQVDENEELVNSILPWKQRAEITWTPTEVVVPFNKGYNPDSSDTDTMYNVVNSAGNRLLADTQRYRFEISFVKNYAKNTTFATVMEPYLNLEAFKFAEKSLGGMPTFPSGTLLMLPPSITKQYIELEVPDEDSEDEGKTKKVLSGYYNTSVKLIYDPQGWDKELLDIGTMAKFNGNTQAEQIYMLTVSDENGTVQSGYPKYTNFAECLKAQAEALDTNASVAAEAITEPLPLDGAGRIYSAAIADPFRYPYKVRKFRQYKFKSFTEFPW